MLFDYFQISYLVYLFVFSHFVCTHLAPLSVEPISNGEVFMWFWSISQLLNEFRQVHVLSTALPEMLGASLR